MPGTPLPLRHQDCEIRVTCGPAFRPSGRSNGKPFRADIPSLNHVVHADLRTYPLLHDQSENPDAKEAHPGA